MKPVFRSTLSAVICIAVLSACAPAKRTFNKASAAPGTTPQAVDANQGTPVQGNIIRAEANLPLDSSNGQINLVDAKGNSSAINIDQSLNATSADASTSNPTFTCQTSGVTTLSQCADGKLTVTVPGTGANAKPATLTVGVFRRSGVPVVSTLSLPTATTPTETDDQTYTASYIMTVVTDDAKTSRAFDTAMIMSKNASDTDAVTGGKVINSEDPNQQVRILVKGALTNKAGTALTVLGSEHKANLLDKNKNIVKSLNVTLANVAQVVTLTVMKVSADGKTPGGSTDLSKFKAIPAVSATAATPATPAAKVDPSTVNNGVAVVPTIPNFKPSTTPPAAPAPAVAAPAPAPAPVAPATVTTAGGSTCTADDLNNGSDPICYCSVPAHSVTDFCKGTTPPAATATDPNALSEISVTAKKIQP